jgi:two-component system response regulator PilR (NtrC family)
LPSAPGQSSGLRSIAHLAGFSADNQTVDAAMTQGRLLVADDEAAIRESLSEVLREEGYEVTEAVDGSAAIAALQAREFDLVIADLRMPGADGIEVLRRTREWAPQTLVILVTAYATLETAVEALRQGAHDYIIKPLIFEDVLGKVRRLLDFKQLAWEAQILRREVESRFDFENLIGKSRAMAEIAMLIRKVAPTNSTVLVTGESGVGKEVVARAIHHFSEQRDKLFLPVNCGAIPENLLESQLFGHMKGAFTGAVSAQEGLFQRARGGTIFLDEIGDLPLNLQVKLHRAIELKEVMPVGSTSPARVEVRIIAATNRVLKDEVLRGTFREDLYYRLNVLEIHVPPLRERREDIPLLVEYFVARHNRDLKKAFKGVDNATMKTLLAFPWKGNVRELDNVIEHAMILGEGEWITLRDLPRSLVDDTVAAIPFSGDCLRDALRSYEKTHIETVLKRTEFDKRHAADLLGISLSSLYRKIEELKILTH